MAKQKTSMFFIFLNTIHYNRYCILSLSVRIFMVDFNFPPRIFACALQFDVFHSAIGLEPK